MTNAGQRFINEKYIEAISKANNAEEYAVCVTLCGHPQWIKLGDIVLDNNVKLLDILADYEILLGGHKKLESDYIDLASKYDECANQIKKIWSVIETGRE